MSVISILVLKPIQCKYLTIPFPKIPYYFRNRNKIAKQIDILFIYDFFILCGSYLSCNPKTEQKLF